MSRTLEILANVVIAMVYFLIASYIAPKMGIRSWQAIYGGVGFFVTCGLTHLHEAWHLWHTQGMDYADMTSLHMGLIHIPQAVFTCLFTWGLYREFVVKAKRQATLLKHEEVQKIEVE